MIYIYYNLFKRRQTVIKFKIYNYMHDQTLIMTIWNFWQRSDLGFRCENPVFDVTCV